MKIAVTAALAVTFLSVSSFCDLIPPDRRIVWEGNVGVEGGIPNRTTIYKTLNAASYGNGTSDASAAIQAALDNCTADQVVFLSEGVFRLSSTVRLGTHVTLRGAGQEKTVLLADDIGIAVMIGREYASSAAVDIVSGYTKGSTQLVLADATSFSVGKYIRIDELNDSSIPVTNTGVGTCTWCSRENGTRARNQVAKITAKAGNTITISPPMFFTFSSGNNPQVQTMGARTESGMYSEFSGIEDLTIKNNWRPDKVKGSDGAEYSAMKDHTASSNNQPVTGSGWGAQWVKTGDDGSALPAWQSGTSYSGDYTTARTPLRTALTANCWAKNIKIERSGARCIELFYNNYRFEIRGCHITGCINRWDSNNCYGTLIGQFTTGVLIEDNIYSRVADGPMFGWGSSGNVVAYNYMYDAHRTNVMRTWFSGIGGSHHGAHTAFNLWEGNELEAFYFDQYWGSHSHNTLFRNRILGRYMIDTIAVPNINNVHTVGTEKNVRYQNYMGNVLGTGGYHNTYENNSVDCSASDKLIYRTGYASSGNSKAADADPQVFNTMLRHMNFDYVNNTTKHCGDAGEPPCQGSDGSASLPASLYLTSKPSWWGQSPWPPIGPDISPLANSIPARLRFEGVTASTNPRISPLRETAAVKTDISAPLVIYDMCGRVVLHSATTPENSRLLISQLPAGVYVTRRGPIKKLLPVSVIVVK